MYLEVHLDGRVLLLAVGALHLVHHLHTTTQQVPPNKRQSVSLSLQSPHGQRTTTPVITLLE